MRSNLQSDVNIYLIDPNDLIALSAVVILAEQSRNGAADTFLVCHSNQIRVGWQPSESSQDLEECVILDVLAKMHSLKRVRVVPFASDRTGSDSSDLGVVARSLVEILRQNAGQGIEISDIRIFGPPSETPLNTLGLFSTIADANVIVIPQDRHSDSAFAREIPQDDEKRFAAHLAVEVASATALWTSMIEGPFDEQQTLNARDGDPRVFLIRSMVRAMRIPALPTATLMSPDQPLPLPTDGEFIRSTDPSWTVERVGKTSLPQEFLFEAANDDASPGEGILDKREAFHLYSSRFISTLLRMPQILMAPISENFDVLTADAVQEAVGRESWVQVLIPDYDTYSSSPSYSDEEIEVAIKQIEQFDASPIYAEVSAAAWRHVYEVPFGVADGNRSSSDLLESAGDSHFLVTERSLLSPEPRQTAESTIQQIYDDIESLLDREEVGTTPTDYPTDEGEQESAVAEPQPLADNLELGSDTEESCSESDSPVGGEPDTTASPQVAASKPDRASHVDEGGDEAAMTPPAPLLVQIGATIRSEQQAASEHLNQSILEIRELLNLGEGSTVEAKGAHRMVLAIGLATLMFGIVVFSGVAKFVSLEWLSPFGNRLVWLAGAVPITLAAATVLWGKHSKRILRLLSFILIISVAVVLAVLPWIRDKSFITDYIGRGRWLAWPLTAAAVLVAIIARSVMSTEDPPWRRTLATINLQLAGLFVYLNLLVAASSFKSFLQPVQRTDPSVVSRIVHLSDATRQRLLFLFIAVGLALTITAIVVISARQVRLELKRRYQTDSLLANVREAQRASRERRRIGLIYGQWLGTAAVMSRIFWNPLGAKSPQMLATAITEDSDLGLEKYEDASISFTLTGHKAIAERIRSRLIQRGWLVRQYRKAAKAYVSQSPSVINNDTPPDEWKMPEECTSVANLKAILSGDADGDRWSFMRAIYEGVLDDELASIEDSLDTQDLLASIIDNPQFIRLNREHAPDNSGTMKQFFDGVIPTELQKLPMGLVEGILFVADDPKRNMETKVSWPEVLVGRYQPNDPTTRVLANGSTTGMGSSVISATRIDISAPFAMSEISAGFRNQSLTAADRPGPLDSETDDDY